jgi:hypothetical protein
MTHTFTAAPTRTHTLPCVARTSHSKTTLASTISEKIQITYASQLYLSGMNLFAVQELLGHAWTATTARYIHEGSGIASGGCELAGCLMKSPARRAIAARRKMLLAC